MTEPGTNALGLGLLPVRERGNANLGPGESVVKKKCPFGECC